ncbi:MAG TPA: hypothetical protein VJS69_09720 [Candidatus Krumholzibacteria bacterium]|nr:hypothetical protein [Candidatus Krumholzibacteria bacterium]
MRAFVQRNFTIVFYVLAAAACAIAFRHLSGAYLYNDDFRWMSQARYQMTPGNLLTFQVFGFFRPLMNVMFYVTERTMRGNIPAYYATNLALHLTNGVLVFHLLARLMRNRAIAAGTALFFLITSTHYAAVGWISARTTLVSTLLLLASMLVLVDMPRTLRRQVAAAVLFALALAAKEDALIGVALLALIALYLGRRQNMLPDRTSIGMFASITIVYVIVRTLVMKHLTQPNWGPGLHIFRNLAGGLLYQFYPWSLASLTHTARSIPVPTHPLWPEILAVPLIVLWVAAGARLKRSREVCFAIAWLVIAMLPMAPFRIRFFTTDWLTHDRYYYLSSMGASLCIVSLLVGVWKRAPWPMVARTAVAATAVIIVCGEISAVNDSDKRFHHMTTSYRTLVDMSTYRLDHEQALTTCAIEGWPMQTAFLQDVFALERPRWKMVSVQNRDEAQQYRPCLYIRFVSRGKGMATESSTID